MRGQLDRAEFRRSVRRQRRVSLQFDRARARAFQRGAGGAAERTRAMGREERCRDREHPANALRGFPLQAGQFSRVVGPEQVAPAGATHEQRAAGERRLRVPALIEADVGRVLVGVPGRQHGAHGGSADRDLAFVLDWHVRESQVRLRRGDNPGAERGQLPSAREVIVVDVRFEHEVDRGAMSLGGGDQRTDISLRVDGRCPPLRNQQIGRITKRIGNELENLQGQPPRDATIVACRRVDSECPSGK